LKFRNGFRVYNGKLRAVYQVYGPRFFGFADIDYVLRIHDSALAQFDEQLDSPFSVPTEFLQLPNVIRDPGCHGWRDPQ
jgi:hypothetical protein